ncbi:hypothetical protein F52700_8459 [Fusarium sp. NRRL 52700]|nr:hypothetical protein F52700_8459 [Fusarium sp. NRRL 52700]
MEVIWSWTQGMNPSLIRTLRLRTGSRVGDEMFSSLRPPPSYVENDRERNERSNAATDDVILLRSEERREAQTSQSSDLVSDETKTVKHGIKLPGVAFMKRSSDDF